MCGGGSDGDICGADNNGCIVMVMVVWCDGRVVVTCVTIAFSRLFKGASEINMAGLQALPQPDTSCVLGEPNPG